MRKRLIGAVLPAVVLSLLVITPVLAYTYYARITIQETNGDSYGMLPLGAVCNNEWLADNKRTPAPRRKGSSHSKMDVHAPRLGRQYRLSPCGHLLSSAHQRDDTTAPQGRQAAALLLCVCLGD